MTLKQYKEIQVETSGKFGGLGLELTMENGVLKVIAPLVDTPAADAGILANDLITQLDGQEVLGTTLSEAIDKMRGQVNTPNHLNHTPVRQGGAVRRQAHPQSHPVESVKANAEGDIGYLRISSFTERKRRRESTRQSPSSTRSSVRVSRVRSSIFLDRAYGRPVQQVDANINEESNVRYYAEVPKPCSTTEEWLAGNPPVKKPEGSDNKPTP